MSTGREGRSARHVSTRSSAYALTVLGTLYRWLMQQRHVLANPAGIKVRGAARVTSRVLGR